MHLFKEKDPNDPTVVDLPEEEGVNAVDGEGVSQRILHLDLDGERRL